MKLNPVYAKKAFGAQQVYYCPYCSRTSLLYLWHNDRIMGLTLDQWLWCPKCKKKFKKGLYGIRESELDAEVTVK